MPRAESNKHLGTQFYHSQFTNSQYLPDSSSSTSPPLSPASQNSSPALPASTVTPGKKKHICGTCDRAFTTSGHLARHSRVHTGERNHKCPFPGCETRCSRQDNLQQHYRIHLSPGSRRSSTRSTSAKGAAAKKGAAAVVNPPPPVEPTPTTPPLSSPPALEPARLYSHHSSPPDSPPPLAQATLPATATLPITNSRMDTASDRSSSAGSPHTSYSSPNHHMGPMSSQQSQNFSGNNGSQTYSYRNGTTTYQEQSQSQGSGAPYTYVHTTPISTSSSSSNGGSFSSYSNGQENSFGNHSNSMHNHSGQNRGSPHSMSSRHSISHISHPQSYSQHQSSSAGPASPASSHSVSSHTSGPPTPTYPVYDDGSHSYNNASNGMIADQNGMHATSHIHSQPHLIQNGYSSNVQSGNGRFTSPPPILAPIQGERLIRRDDRHSQSHHAGSPYIHHPQPLPTEYPYHQSLALSHGAWKGESGMRKNVGTALV